MFHDISYYIPLRKELKKKNFPQKEILKRLFSPDFIPLPRWMGSGDKIAYYDFIVQNTFIEKLEDEIRYEKEMKKKKIMINLSKYDDINERWEMIETVKKKYKGKFIRKIRLIFLLLLTFMVERSNCEMLKFLMEKYGKYVALIDKIYVRKKDEEVMKYIKYKGLDKQIKIKDRKPNSRIIIF